MKKKVNVLLVDDHKIVREGIRYYLEENSDIKVVCEAGSGEAAIELLKERASEIEVAIVDISMGGMTGFELTEFVTKNYPHIHVIGLSMFHEPQHIKQMMNAGAKGYLLKNSSQQEIVAAIEKVLAGETYFSPEVTEIVMNNLAGRSKKNYSRVAVEMPLTKRELEILEMIIKEHSNQEIADALFISLRTVDAHKRNLLEKTGSKNVAGLVLYAVHNNLFSDLL